MVKMAVGNSWSYFPLKRHISSTVFFLVASHFYHSDYVPGMTGLRFVRNAQRISYGGFRNCSQRCVDYNFWKCICQSHKGPCDGSWFRCSIEEKWLAESGHRSLKGWDHLEPETVNHRTSPCFCPVLSYFQEQGSVCLTWVHSVL